MFQGGCNRCSGGRRKFAGIGMFRGGMRCRRLETGLVVMKKIAAGGRKVWAGKSLLERKALLYDQDWKVEARVVPS